MVPFDFIIIVAFLLPQFNDAIATARSHKSLFLRSAQNQIGNHIVVTGRRKLRSRFWCVFNIDPGRRAAGTTRRRLTSIVDLLNHVRSIDWT